MSRDTRVSRCRPETVPTQTVPSAVSEMDLTRLALPYPSRWYSLQSAPWIEIIVEPPTHKLPARSS